ncbi:hypothetical protein CRUP_007188 [Coryphaenoides rupestris]|nr:hypothetical protein CRUP_007188 [Coryphaenoides rupestris]
MLSLCGETEERLAQELVHFEYHQSSKSSSHPSTLQPGAKSESLREEMEEAANRMEICRDQLSADMFSFVAKEIDYANYFQTLIEIQAEYHRKSLDILTGVLPQIKAQQAECDVMCRVVQQSVMCRVVQQSVMCRVVQQSVSCRVVQQSVMCRVVQQSVMCRVVQQSVMCRVVQQSVMCRVVQQSVMLQ